MMFLQVIQLVNGIRKSKVYNLEYKLKVNYDHETTKLWPMLHKRKGFVWFPESALKREEILFFVP